MFSFSKPIDPLTLAEEMRKSGVYDEQTTRSYLAQLVDFTFSSANVMDWAMGLLALHHHHVDGAGDLIAQLGLELIAAVGLDGPGGWSVPVGP